MVLGIEVLRVQAFPPFTHPVGFCQPAVVGHFLVVAVLVPSLCTLVPSPCVVGVERDAQRQPRPPGGFCPSGQQVALGTDSSRVPGLVLGVPKVEIIVVVA